MLVIATITFALVVLTAFYWSLVDLFKIDPSSRAFAIVIGIITTPLAWQAALWPLLTVLQGMEP